MNQSPSWTIHRAAGMGTMAGLAAAILWPAYANWPNIILLPFLLALVVAAACGAAMLWITVNDLRRRSDRGRRVRPIRSFDILLGLALVIPSLIELRAVAPDGLLFLGL